MISWQQSELFVVRFLGQEKGVRREPWKIEIGFQNLAVDPIYFDQCIEKVFVGDKGVSVQGKKIVFERSDKIRNEGAFCRARAKELLNLLKTHPNWGKSGGPDLSADYHNMD